MNQFFKLFLVCCMTVSLIPVHAQSVISTTGAYATGSGGTVSYTIGQVTFSTFSGVTGTITQGVQQPYEISVVSAVVDAGDIELKFTVYPNPASDMLTLKIEDQEIINMSYRLFSLNGNLIDAKEIVVPETIINMQFQVSGTYFLKILSGKRDIKTFKIIKN